MKLKAMLPGHFKIPGHSGTDFKNRKAFRRLKETNKISIFKYGDQYGQQKREVDERRMARAEKEKNQKLMRYGVLFFMLCCVMGVGADRIFKQLLNDLLPVVPVEKYLWQAHASESVMRSITHKEEIRAGYLAWGEGDYDKAISVFESIDVDSVYWTRKEHALLSLYYDYCNYSGKYCEEYKQSRKKLRADGGELIQEDYKDKYFKDVFEYNRKMVAFYKEGESSL